MPLIFQRLFSPRPLRPLFWLMWVFSLVMALLPKPPSTPIDRFGDKFAHMLAFAALTLVARLAWRQVSIWRQALWLCLFGAGIEVLQAIPMLNRTSDVRDWLADSAAIACAGLFAQLLLRFLPESRPT